MKKKFSLTAVLFCLVLLTAIDASAQIIDLEIQVPESNPTQIGIKGKFAENKTERNLNFLLSYADSDNLATRVSDIELFDANDQRIDYRKIAVGSYIAAQPYNSFAYRINAAVPANVLSTAHISWIAGRKGVLRLSDLMPEFETVYRTEISVKLPSDWKLSSSEKLLTSNSFTLSSDSNEAFVIGRDWKNHTFKVSETTVNLILDEQWKLDEAATETIIRDILLSYEKHFGAIPDKNLQIVNFRFPKDVGFDRWRAETFGRNIFIMSAPPTFDSKLKQRFQEQLRHELFHLWLPNNLALEGNYAWFYEGFAQYTALKTGVQIGQISFPDFLDTLGQAHNLGNRRSQQISLLDASKNRWVGEDSSIYAKGLAVAFLFDVALLKQSDSKRDLLTLLGQIYDKHKIPNKTEDANPALLRIFESHRALAPIISDYVRGTAKLNFRNYLEQTGIESQSSGSNIKLQVKNDLSGREKDFLDKLGYNDWRKFVSK